MPTTHELAVEVDGLHRSFGATQAVDDVDLTVHRGTVYGVLGPNGAGKTTLVRILATLLRPDAGSARVCGFDVVQDADEVRSRVSLTGQFAAVDGDLTGVENLILVGRLLGLSRRAARRRANELLDGFELSAAAGRLLRTYSGGMRRRLDIAASLVTPPEVLFLDEPTTGVDPRSRHDVWDIVRGLTGAGTTVLLTTQYLAEADELADRIAVLDDGMVIADGTSGELKASVGGGRLRVRVRDPQQRTAAQYTLSEALGADVLPDSDAAGLVARTGDADLAAAAVAQLSGAGIAVSDFAHDQPTLDEVFFTLTGTERGVPAGAGEERV